MAITWKRKGDTMVQYRDGVPTGQKYSATAGLALTDGYSFNNWLGMSKGNTGQFQDLIQATLSSGKRLTKAEYNAYARENGLKGITGAWDNISKDVNKWMTNNGIDIDNFNPETGKTYTDDEMAAQTEADVLDNFNNTTNMDMEGTIANRVYQDYLKAAEETYNVGMEQSQIAERDLERNLAVDRNALLDQIRNERRTMLKSGLSQAAIANREVQGLLQGQQQAQANAQTFIDERRNLQQNYGMRDSLARQSYYSLLGDTQFGNMLSAVTASNTGDALQQALGYARLNNKNKQAYDTVTDHTK